MYLVYLISIDLELSRLFNSHTCTVTANPIKELIKASIKLGIIRRL